MEAALATGALVLLVLVFLAIGKYHPMSGAQVVDWRPTRSPELEAELELEDIDQMLEAQNERRRRTGRPELTEDDINAGVQDFRREHAELLERYQREQDTIERREPEGSDTGT